MKKIYSLIFVLLTFASFAKAQQAEVTIQLNEQFFDALLDALFKNSGAVEFPLAKTERRRDAAETPARANGEMIYSNVNFTPASNRSASELRRPQSASSAARCSESIKLQREIDGVRTAVRFRDGRIYAPIAFTGEYNPPLIGCINFSGWAESFIELQFDREKQALVGRAVIANVQLSGTGGVGSSVVTRLVQSAIDRKMNPIQILPMDKISFAVPVQNAGTLRMKAVGMRHDISGQTLNLHIAYQFQ